MHRLLALLALLLSLSTSAFSQDPAPPANTAIVPVSKLEDDSYDWWARHAALLQVKDETNPEIVLIGDSITHFWGGNPGPLGGRANGPESFRQTFAGKRVLNLGFGWDRTQNVLWRLDHGEFDGLHPQFVVINIGTNNFAATSHARENTPAEIAAGVREVVLRVRAKSPASRIIVMGIFPRGEKASDPLRAKIAAVNGFLAELGPPPGVIFLDIGAQFTGPDGTISRELMGDFLHPSDAGYAIWGKALLAAMK